MATNKPRLTITLDSDNYELLKELSELQKVSVSFLINDLVSTTSEPLKEVLKALRVLNSFQSDTKRSFVNANARAQHELGLISELAMSVLGGVVEGFVSASGDSQPLQPPYSNHGGQNLQGVDDEQQGS